MVREAGSYLNEIVDQWKSKDFPAELHVRYGDVAEEIISHSRPNEIELISMSTHGRGGLGRCSLGSVAEKIVRHSGIFDEPGFCIPACSCHCLLRHSATRGHKPASYFPLFSLQQSLYVTAMTD